MWRAVQDSNLEPAGCSLAVYELNRQDFVERLKNVGDELGTTRTSAETKSDLVFPMLWFAPVLDPWVRESRCLDRMQHYIRPFASDGSR